MNRYERLNEERKIIEKRKRVAAYCRVSTDNEDQANSFESQQRYFKQYIERNPDWELYEIFADEGISGTSTKKRKEFNRMIACAKNGDFDLIITKEISRFARNTLDSIYYTRDLKKHGVGVIFMNDNINTLDGDAELRLAIMSSIAQEESRKTSERVKWGQKRQMEQGVVFGRSMLGYDVKDGKMTINEEGAKIVRLIFHKFVNEGKGTHVIARELREEGIEPMRVKEWQNTVILRVIRNEKYCGDLVQKKTYTPDFLSHEKKYNRGQEEFVIIKDHHEPIVSRELFEEANRILDERSLSQEGKAKHSNRYPFSGKIKCGHCGASYVARYKTRKDGSKYKAWRCQEAAKHGSPHTDKAGNQIGCTGASIRNEDATHIMFLVTKELKLRQTKITKNLTSIIESIIAMDTTGTDIEKLKTQIATIEDKRTKLIDIYMSGDISKDEFSAARSKCDAEIAELQSVIDSIDKQQAMIRQQQELVQEIRDAINEIVCGVEYDDEFYKHILDKMVVNDKDNIDVYLNLLPMKWSYTVAKASKKALAPERNISGASVPTEELIDKYCPIISDVINSNPEYAALTTYPDGHRYGFPTIIESYGLVLTQGPFLINKAWLDQLGLSVPTNLDEFKQVLIAFRDAGDLNGNGEADEIPYAVNFVDSNGYATNNSLFYLMSCFGETGTYGDWYPYTKIGEDKKVEFSVLDDAFRKVLNFYHELYEENLLDLDGFAGDGKYQYKLQQDVATIGVFATWAPSNDIPVKDVYNQYVALPRLTGPEGSMGSVNNRSEVQQPSGFLITTECKYPEIAAAIANYMSIPHIAPQINYGVIGDMFVVDENGVLRYPIDEEGHFILPEGYETFAEVRANNTPAKNVIILSEYFDTVVDYAWDAVDLLEFQKQNGKEAILAEGNPTPPVIMTVEEQAIYSQIRPQIENVVKNFMVSSVLDGSADANWESFEKQLKDAGLDQMMEVIQSAYDRYLVTYDAYAEMMK